jgi:hypothetical protein
LGKKPFKGNKRKVMLAWACEAIAWIFSFVHPSGKMDMTTSALKISTRPFTAARHHLPATRPGRQRPYLDKHLKVDCHFAERYCKRGF